MTKILEEIDKEEDEEKRFAIIYKLTELIKKNAKKFRKEFVTLDEDEGVDLKKLKNKLYPLIVDNPKWTEYRNKRTK